jgi:hypothetical protein
MAGRRARPSGVQFPVVVFDMEPDEEEFRLDMMLFAQNVSDYSKPLRYSKQIIIEDTKKTFRLERDPETGDKWKPLSDRALRVPRYGILQRRSTRRFMYRSVTNKNHYGISKAGVWFNQSKLPEYAVYHQQDEKAAGGRAVTLTKGAIEQRARSIQAYEQKHKLRPTSGKGLVTRAIRELREEATEGTGEIPQRRFLGVSKLAQRDLIGTFDAWAKDAIIIYKRGSSLVSARRPSR